MVDFQRLAKLTMQILILAEVSCLVEHPGQQAKTLLSVRRILSMMLLTPKVVTERESLP